MNSVLGYSIQSLFDPVQTHAAKGVPVERVDEVKQALKERGAVRFRVVKNRYGFAAVCFKMKKVKA